MSELGFGPELLDPFIFQYLVAWSRLGPEDLG